MSRDEVVIVHLKAANAPQITENRKLKMRTGNDFQKVGQMLKKKLGLGPDETLFLYFKQFAIYPDTRLCDLLEHSPGTTEVDVNYSLDPQFG